MNRFLKYFLALCWISFLLLASVAVFLSGFLLNRDVLPQRSTCIDIRDTDDYININLQIGQFCTIPRSRVVLIIIDALMYDFTMYINMSRGSEAFPYENKMPIFSELLAQKPSQTLLYKFVADPPTTTMQRLKGLTTGSLPTFIDAGSNFASSEIDEDNFLDKLKYHNKSMVFMGDDTWNSLYPNRFMREYPYPSFNVWDLDTVDRGVERHLLPEIKKKDWALLVAHFLGVDHCGHRYGNHGGDSLSEITAAFFAYSPHSLLGAKLATNLDSINQVDLVPTLSTILGSPIPFSSLGALVAEALPSTTDNWRNDLAAVLNNLNQVHTYVDAYAAATNQFTETNMAMLRREHQKLQQSYLKVKSFEDFRNFLSDSRRYFKSVKSMCEEIWIQFDLFLMAVGLFFMILSLLVIVIIIQNIPSQKLFTILDSRKPVFAAATVFLSSVLTWTFFRIFLMTSCVLTLCLFYVFIFNSISHVKSGFRAQKKHCDWLSFVTFLLILGNLLGMFSNSYVVEEGTVVSFWTVTIVLALVLGWKRETGKGQKNIFVRPWLPVSLEKLLLVSLASVFSVAIRLLPNYWQCREEQAWCQATRTDTDSISSELALLPVAALPVLVTWIWLKRCGNLVGLAVPATVIKVTPVLVTLLSFIYWVLESLPRKVLMKMVPWNIQLLPQAVYFLLTVALLCLLIRPLCVHVVPARNENLFGEGDKNILPRIFQQIKSALNDGKGSKRGRIPAVFGLPTVFSASFVVIGLFLLQLLTLLQGSKVAPALVIMFFVCSLLLATLGITRVHTAVLPPQILYVPMYAIAAWSLETGQKIVFEAARLNVTVGGCTRGRHSALSALRSTLYAELKMQDATQVALLLVVSKVGLAIRLRLHAKSSIFCPHLPTISSSSPGQMVPSRPCL
ncbi:UNVERIFIED_CONTAM: hypothetical protein B566_EDAN019094 [Ephemera danica]|nr:hypothetical protein B566_EDAN019094 [Ephemera danica]